MTGPANAVDLLLSLPRARRRQTLADLVDAEVREVLLLPDDAETGADVSFFDLGMTSLRLTELRQRLTRMLDRRIEIEALFEHPTSQGLTDHLADTVLSDVFPGTVPASAPSATPAPQNAQELPPMVQEILRNLYS
ncbi:acyl carrier protein [Streptomyces sp. NPDC059679]|uniref:acyl carrier protein n=1 Tax=Streptomyces sp. NPDC059679 TaxID=3346903 RepID=UPI0036741EB7